METRQPPHLNIRANLGLVYWQQGDVMRASQHIEAARAQMIKEGGTFLTERNAVESLAKLEAEVDALVTLERAVAGRVPVSPPLLALPLIFERKGLALEEKAATVKTFGADPGGLREYQSLLAYRARLARGTPLQPGDPSVTNQRMGEAEFQIQSLEYDARIRVQTESSSGPPLSSKDAAEQSKYQNAIAKEMGKLYEDYYKRSKNDRRPEAEVMMQLNTAARAKVDPKFPHVVAAQQTVTRGVREELLGRIQAQLSESSVLLEMLHFRPMNVSALTASERWQPARYGAYVVRRSGAPVFVDCGDAAPIDEMIVEFRRTLVAAARHARARSRPPPRRRADAAAAGGARHRDADLSVARRRAQPRAVWRTGRRTRSLSRRDLHLQLPLERSGSGPPAGRADGRDLAPAVVIADPAFDAGATATVGAGGAPSAQRRSVLGNHFDPLPGTAAEAQAIKGLLADAVVFTGDQRDRNRAQERRPRRACCTSPRTVSSSPIRIWPRRPGRAQPPGGRGSDASLGARLRGREHRALRLRRRRAHRARGRGARPLRHRARRAVRLRDRRRRRQDRRRRVRPAPRVHGRRRRDAGDEPVAGGRRRDADS